MKTRIRPIIVLTVLAAAALFAACQPVNLPARSEPKTEPTPTDTAAPPETREQNSADLFVIGVGLSVESASGRTNEVVAGEQARARLDFTPSQLSVILREDGSRLSTNWKPWDDSGVAEMDLCFSVESPCDPQGKWRPFELSAYYDLPVDWLGEKSIYAAARFRDIEGQSLPAGKAYEYESMPEAHIALPLISRASETPGAGGLSEPVLTAQAATRAAFPVTGSVEIEGGRCCAGGTAGDEVKLDVAFNAKSPAGKVTEMRVSTTSGCQRDAPSLDAPWEPFELNHTYKTTLALNWVGFYVNVQYRDEQGSLSPVYCDDISLEGSPKQ